MIDALLRAAGLRTGRFSSPHVMSVTERIAVNGEPISEDRFDEIYRKLAPYIELVDSQQIDGVEMTFFEIITAMAYATFADAPVDVAIIEVGLGGTWDATNVADGDVAVITPIDIDHAHLLGSTVAEIATEKAGIIKPGAQAILAGQQVEAAQVLLERCAEVGALVQREGLEFGVLERLPAVGGQLLRLNAAEGPVDEIFLPLYGAHQAANAAQALAAAEAFLGMKALAPEVVREGFAGVTHAGSDGGRPPVTDHRAGRGPQSARGARRCGNGHRGVRLLTAGRRIAVMGDKDVSGILEVWSELMQHVVVTEVASTGRGIRRMSWASSLLGCSAPTGLPLRRGWTTPSRQPSAWPRSMVPCCPGCSSPDRSCWWAKRAHSSSDSWPRRSGGRRADSRRSR